MTSGEVWYLETSAAVKLLRREPESSSLRRWLRDRPRVSSDLLRTEVRRAMRRTVDPHLGDVDAFLDSLTLIRLDVPAFERAGLLEPASLRSLDALHLAAAESLGPDLAGIVTYDERLTGAAALVGMVVAAPS